MKETKFETQGGKLTVTRTFDAPVGLVWRAWTEAELLDQWWAPKPWKSETSYMDFSEGGYRLYAMVGPEGEKHWARMDFSSIDKPNQFSGADAFTDENGNVNKAFPVATFVNSFTPNGEKTEVVMVTNYEKEEDLKQVLQMGMQEGLDMAFENLDGLLTSL